MIISLSVDLGFSSSNSGISIFQFNNLIHVEDFIQKNRKNTLASSLVKFEHFIEEILINRKITNLFYEQIPFCKNVKTFKALCFFEGHLLSLSQKYNVILNESTIPGNNKKLISYFNIPIKQYLFMKRDIRKSLLGKYAIENLNSEKYQTLNGLSEDIIDSIANFYLNS